MDCIASSCDPSGAEGNCDIQTSYIHPFNDCANKGVLPSVTQQTVSISAYCTTLDGPASVVCDDEEPEPFEGDIWYSYVAPCNSEMTVSLCSGTNYDALMAVYGGGDTCECPTAETEPLICADDTCGVSQGPPTVTIPVTAGACYTIRIGKWGHHRPGTGQMSISVSCAAPANRYIALNLGNPGESLAVRATLSSLHHPDPPNPPGSPPLDYSAFEGDRRWVGPPATFVETVDPPTYFTGAPLQCTPHYRDWSAAALIADGLPGGEVQVFGEEILPSSVYVVQTIAQGLDPGVEGNYSSGWPFETARWGDVVPPYQEPSPAVVTQPDFFDVSSVIDKWIGADISAPVIARADLEPGATNQSMNFFDISAAIDAWQQLAYPFPITTDCP
jgi:hypothetical protein